MGKKRGNYLKKKDVFKFLDDMGAYNQFVDYQKTLYDAFIHGNSARGRKRLDRLYDEWLTTTQIPGEEVEPPVSGGTMDDPAQRRVGAAEGAKTYIFTCAQNNTDLIPASHWNTLMQVVDFYDAELHVARFTYNKAAYGNKSVKPGSKKGTDEQDIWYADEIAQYISDEDVQVAPDLVWLGSLNLIPTLVNPITGFQTHTRQASCIIPHTKMAMESVATMKHEPAKFVYTTGCVTQRNYIQKSAGQKADFHHVFGALLVEVDDDGNWWARQLNFDADGTLYDLQHCFGSEHGVISPVRAAAVTHGDIHGHKMDEAVIESVFEPNGMLDVLAPREQFFHDIIDFMPRNHHNRKDFQFLREMHLGGTTSVMGEFALVSAFLMTTAYRSWCRSYVVVSNHDQAIDSWLADRTQLDDPVNLQDWLELNLRKAQNPKFHPFKYCVDMCCHAARSPDKKQPDTKLLPRVIVEDASYKILGMIEAGLHGHLGPNGARGNPRNLRTAGKANTGHTHSAGIVEGVYTAGVLGKLDMGYNKGLSSWSHSSIVTYPNGKRAILTHRAGKWWR